MMTTQPTRPPQEGGTTPEPTPVFRIPAIAARLDVQPGVVYDMIRAGKLRAVRVGRSLRVPQSALDDFLAGR